MKLKNNHLIERGILITDRCGVNSRRTSDCVWQHRVPSGDSLTFAG